MAASPQLRLVQDAAPVHGATQDPVRQVFEHWVYMFGKLPQRTKLDADRKKVIQLALHLYDGDVQLIMLAVDGMAALPVGDRDLSMHEAMCEPTWFLANAKRIESAMRWGDKLRDQGAQQAASGVAQPLAEAAQTPESAAAAKLAREKLRALAVQGRNGVWRHD